MAVCLTTQQRSGPKSPVTKFLLTKPLPLNYSRCAEQGDLAEFARDVLTDFGGLRRSTTIGKELATNMAFLRKGGWELTLRQVDDLRTNPHQKQRNEQQRSSTIIQGFWSEAVTQLAKDF